MKQVHNEAESVRALEGLLDLVAVFADLMERGMQERGLTRARAAVLWELRHGEPATQKALADRLGVTPRNVTGLVDALEEGGYVTREKHPTDRRALLVTLTEKGAGHVDAMRTDLARWANGLFGGVPAEDVAAFGATVDVLRGRMRRG